MNNLDNPATARRRWSQYSLRSLMAMVAVICLGLGGWHLLLKYGQYVEAEPAVVGQPIKIRGRFFHVGGANDAGNWRYKLTVYPTFASGPSMVAYGNTKYVGWWSYEIDDPQFDAEGSPGEFTMTLTPEGGSPIRGTLVVRAAD
jgi:hypothetical protein